MNANDHDRRLEEVAAYAIGALDPERVAELERHLEDCGRCQEELRWLSPAVRALPEAVERQAPPPRLKERLMAEVRADAAKSSGAGDERPAAREPRPAGEEVGAGAERREGDPAGIREWLAGLGLGGMTWKPLAGLALVILVVAGGIGYLVGNDNGGSGGNTHTWEIEPGANGVEAKVVREGDRAEVQLAGVRSLPKGRVLEAWVERDGAVEAVSALFAPDQAGRASTTIEDMNGVSAVMVTREPSGGTEKPTTKPIVEVPLES
ncbi:MAG TPA: anti-sigma factor [Solirubrobacterales bacterium]|jgi:hypothetical protein